MKIDITSMCFYHADSDGRMSAAIVKSFDSNCRMIEIEHGFDEGWLMSMCVGWHVSKIYIVDFSFSEEIFCSIIRHLVVLKKGEIIWIDHHKSAMEKLSEMWHSRKIKGFRSIKNSGCVLTWKYFYPEKEIPRIVKLVEDYDLWKFKYGDQTKYFAEFNRFFNLHNFLYFLNNSDGTIELAINDGKIMYLDKLMRIKERLKKGEGKEIIFKGYKTLLINNTEFFDGSLLGNEICADGYDVALKYGFKETQIVFGLNSKGRVDVSKIAMGFGGGGHKNASGFTLDIKEGLKLLKKLNS